MGPLAITRQVLTIHDLSPLDHPEWFAPAFALWYGQILPPLARRVRRVLTPSSFSRQRVIQRLKLPADKVVVVQPGVDPAQFRPVDPSLVRVRYGLAESYLLFVGSLEPRKNLPALLSAWGEVRARFSAAELVIAGARSPVFRPALNGQAKTPSLERVRFLGAVPDSDLPALYSGAAALLLPSLYEGFGLPVMEAMACGAPVISSSAWALKETAGEAALLVDPVDAEGLSCAIEQILGDEGLRAALRARGFDRAASFPWSRTAGRIWSILQDEAESHG
jgi:glycosyltransferase involved in cell wall biosynthesis